RFAPEAPAGCSSFNPPPARWPGETMLYASIKTEGEGFQSAPGPMARGNVVRYNEGRGEWEFQSAPGPMARGNWRPSAARAPESAVSIRPRPDGQGKRASASARPPRTVGFQSAPGPMARGNRRAGTGSRPKSSFNPPPARWPGETRTDWE